MGASIAGITGSLAALRSSPDFGQVRLDAHRDPLNLPGARQADGDGRGLFFSRQEPRQIQVGFGRGLSTQGAALRTLKTTIELTRRTMPTIEEIRRHFIVASSARRDEAQRTSAEQSERTLTRRDEAQRTSAEQTENTLTRRVESRIPEASAQARKFISDLEEAASEEQVRFEESETEKEVTARTILFNGEQFGIGSSENKTRLDVRV